MSDPAQTQTNQCRYCTGPIESLSTGGPDVCVLCEVYGVPPLVVMGRKQPWDFHDSRRGIKHMSGSEPTDIAEIPARLNRTCGSCCRWMEDDDNDGRGSCLVRLNDWSARNWRTLPSDTCIDWGAVQ